MSENDCTFKIPPHICKKLGIEKERDEFKEYMVKDNGELYLPWYGMHKLGFWGVPYSDMREAGNLLESLHETERKKCKKMIGILIDYHEDKFDRQKGMA